MSESQDTLLQSPEYWTTLSEYHQDEEYLARVGEEFFPDAKPQNFFEAAEDEEKLLTPMHRRTFLKLSGFAALASALAACERPVQKIVPYVVKPEEITLGVSNYYASSLSTPEGCGLLIKTREGRPIKLEGNPEHPLNKGTLGVHDQVEILKLYDPDRLKAPVRVNRKGNATPNPTERMAQFDGEVGAAIKAATGKVVLLTPTLHGPANERVIEGFRSACRQFEHVSYDALQGGEILEAHRLVFGQAVAPQYHFDRATTIVCFGGDPLTQSYAPVQTQNQIGRKHRPDAEGGMARLYVFEPVPTLTGMKADYRYLVNPTHLLEIALAVAGEVILRNTDKLKNPQVANNSAVRELLGRYTAASAGRRLAGGEAEIKRVADSLVASQGSSVVYINSAAARTKDALALELVGVLLNHALGSYGETLDITTAPSRQLAASTRAIKGLIDSMKAGEVDVLITWGVNPVYTLPADSGIAEAVGRVKLVTSLSLKMDETTALADIAIPGVHSLETWGDAEPVKGLFNLQQPAINTLFGPLSADPIHDTRSWQESLMAFSRAAGAEDFLRPAVDPETDPAPRAISWYDFVRETWSLQVHPRLRKDMDFEGFWLDTLHLGFADARASVPAGALTADFSSLATTVRPSGDVAGLVLVTLPTAHHGDGQTMGMPHMLEMPDPVTKIAWDNYFMVSPKRAAELGVKDGDHLTVSANGRTAEGPVRIQPGMHDEVVAVYLGWGRDTRDGIGHNLGINAYALQSMQGGLVIASGVSATVAKAKGHTKLADAQGHNYMFSPEHAGVMVNKRKGDIPEGATVNASGKAVYERPIIGETTLNEWKQDPYHAYPNNVAHGDNPPSIWEGTHKYVGHHWGMVVDLNACNGCGACIVACSLENNIPVVGKEELAMGREMFWIRIDRYYRGTQEDPVFAQMPLMCHHCDNAPCETVCPVVATLHNDEGLNVMVYNRCVGTRYCANNCPYKVRRFNFWQYADWRTGPRERKKVLSPLELVLNPDVTTRGRGVMEKCTFCIQRLRTAKDKARLSGEPLQDGAVQTACQQTCPAQAITFGDRNDPNSAVAKVWNNPRSYGLLADLNTDPSVRYMALVRNRDEKSPFRTKYQSHRVDHAHADDHGHDNDHGHAH